MSLVTLPFTFSVGAVIIAAQHNSNFSTIYNDYNGNIQDVNIASNAAIGYAKLALNNSIRATDILSTEVLNISNLPTGTTANKLVELDSSAKIPAVDGSQLTHIGTNITSALGAWTTQSNGVATQAPADGFVVATNTSSGSTMTIKSDSSNPPTTVRITAGVSSGTSCATIPVRKNDYYLTTNATTVLYIPLGS